MRGRASLRLFQQLPQLGQALPARAWRTAGEQRLLLLTNVVSDTFNEDGDLGGEALVVRTQSLDLGAEPFHHVVLLEALEDLVGHVRNLVTRQRDEKTCSSIAACRLSSRMIADAVSDLVDLSPLAGLLEPPEQSLHGLVVETWAV